MKKVTLFAIAIAAFSFTQVEAQRIGFRGGLNMSGVNTKVADKQQNDDSKIKLGYQVGPVVEFEIGDALALETGLLASAKGSKQEVEKSVLNNTVTSTGTSNLTYLEIPINFKYKADLGSIGAYVHAGPYLAYAIAGKTKGKVVSKGIINSENKIEKKIDFGKEANETNPFDYGFNVGAGLELGDNIQVGINYGLGLRSLVNTPDNAPDNFKKENFAKNRVFSVGVTYFFN